MTPLRILVADDQPDKRLIVLWSLARHLPGSEIVECSSGEEALHYCAAHRVDALITDQHMHPTDGLKLAQQLKSTGATMPIIMVSAHDEFAPQAMKAGVDLFLSSENLHAIGRPIAEFLQSWK